MPTATRTTARTTVHRTVSGLEQSPDQAVMKAALGFQEISVDIPTNATLSQVEETLSVAIEGYKRLANGIERIKPLIGRILFTIEQRKLFRPTYKNMTEFLSTVVEGQMKFSHTSATDALRIAKKFPTLTADQYQNYGATRLLYAAQVTSEAEEGYKELLDESTRMTTEEFKTVVDSQKQQKALDKPGVKTVVLTMRVLPEVKMQFDTLLASLDVPAGDLLTMLMHQFNTKKK